MIRSGTPPEDSGTWISQADTDLEAARTLLLRSQDLLRLVLFHAQQAVEKALKAMLIAEGHPYPLSHDLTLLLDECGKIDAAIEAVCKPTLALTRFAVQFRYPGNPPPITEEEAEGLLQASERAVVAIRARIAPSET